MTRAALLAAALLLASCADPTPQDWQPSKQIAADWLAKEGIGIIGPLPTVTVVPHDKLQESVVYPPAKDWIAGREVRAAAYPALRVIQLSDRLDPARDRSTLVREMSAISCFERGICQPLDQEGRESWIGAVQAKFESEQ